MSATTRTVAALCRLLSHGDEADCCHAAHALGVVRDPAAVPALIECLAHPDPDVCIDTAAALGEIGDTLAITPLLELLHNHPESEVRSAAVEALGNFRDPRVVEALLDIAANRPENLMLDDEWDDWWDMQLHAIKALGEMRAAEAVPVLRRLLDDEESQGIEAELLTALAQIGGEGLEAVGQRLSEGTPAERRRAAAVLGHVGGEEAVSLLGRTVLDEDAEVRSTGLKALGAAATSGYFKLVLISFRDPVAQVRNAAIEAAARLADSRHDSELTEQLTPLLDDPDPLVRATTIRTLTDLASRHPLPPELPEQIRLRLSDGEPSVAAAACHFLAEHRTPRAEEELLRLATRDDRGIHLRQQAILALGSSYGDGEKTVDILSRAIDSDEQLIRKEALTALMKLATSDAPVADTALQTVISTLERRPEKESPAPAGDSPLEQSETALENDALPPATSTLDVILNTHREMRRRRVEKPDAGRDTLEIAPEELPELQEYLELAEQGAPALTETDRVASSDLPLLGARVLAHSNREEVITALIGCIGSGEPELRTEAAVSLGRIAADAPGTAALQGAVGPLLIQLELGDEKMRHESARTLALLGSAASLPHLLATLRDPSSQVRIEAIRSLVTLSMAPHKGEFPFAGIVRHLQECLGDPAAGVRVAAAHGLASLATHPAAEPRPDSTIRAIVAAACADNGSQARQMGRILKRFQTGATTAILLQRLESCSTSSERHPVIELLEETVAPSPPI